MSKSINNFMNDKGQLTSFPAKWKMKIQALVYLSQKFEQGKSYTEKEVNDLLNQWHTFGDSATLRRELYNNKFIDREKSGNSYWLIEEQPDIEKLEKKYG